MHQATLKNTYLNRESGDIHFIWSVSGKDVEVVLTWEFGNGVPESQAGTEEVRTVTSLLGPFFDRYRMLLHRMLVEGRHSYESGPWASLNPAIPSATFCQCDGLNERGHLSFCITVNGGLVQGSLEPELSWNCHLSDNQYSEWATAWHAALDYVIEHRDEVAHMGFDSRELDRQLANLDIDVVADWTAFASAKFDEKRQKVT